MTTRMLVPTITILPRLAFGAAMPPLCEAAVNQAFRSKAGNAEPRPHR